MQRALKIFISITLGCLVAIAIPAALIALGQPSLGTSVWGSMFSAYLQVAGLMEPVVWAVLPWQHLIPGGGASGAFAITLVCILASWGVFFSGLWLFLFRARGHNDL